MTALLFILKLFLIVMFVLIVARVFSILVLQKLLKLPDIDLGPSILVTLTFLVVAEQALLWGFLDARAMNDEASQTAFVKDVEKRIANGENFRHLFCEQVRLVAVYTYKLCAVHVFSNEPIVAVYGVLPPGYLTLVPWNYSDRELWDGFSVTSLDIRTDIISK